MQNIEYHKLKGDLMKICFLCEDFGIGGIERVTSVVGSELSKYNEISYFSLLGTSNYYDVNPIYYSRMKKSNKSKFLNYKNYIKKLIQLSKNDFSPAWFYLEEVKLFTNWIDENNIDIVIVSGPLLTAMIPYLKKVTNVKFVAWMHNSYEIYMDNYSNGFKRYFIEGMRESDQLIVLTSSDCEKYSYFNGATSMIYNPLTIKNSVISDLSACNIAFTARIVFEHKGIDYLLEVAEKIPEGWTISIAGNGPEENKLKDIIKEKKLEKKVILLGGLKGRDLVEHYYNASIYLMTSRWEGMGLVLAEAMSFGLPIVAFAQTGSKEVLDNGEYGVLVENGKVNDLVKQLEILINSYDNRMYYQKKSLERVEAFDLSNIAEKWCTILKKIYNEELRNLGDES